MDNAVGKMVEHPVATMLIITTLACGIARIVAAATGRSVPPVVNINASSAKDPA